jgi:hypothetical protein
MDFDASHWVGLAAIHAAQLTAARFLHEHKPHCLVAHRTEWGSRLGLRHDSRLDQAGAQNSQSPVGADRVGDGTSMELKFRRRWSILLTIPKLTLAIPNMIFQKSFSLFKSGHCQNQIKPLKHKTGHDPATRAA